MEQAGYEMKLIWYLALSEQPITFPLKCNEWTASSHAHLLAMPQSEIRSIWFCKKIASPLLAPLWLR